MQPVLVRVGKDSCRGSNEGNTERGDNYMMMDGNDCIYPVLQRALAVAEPTCCLASMMP